ncbi:MAG: hypothetical protein ABEJ61_08170 [Haloferacaceae archaeon]
MEPSEVEEYVQSVANTSDFEVKEVDHDRGTIYIRQTDMDEKRTVLLAAVLFDQIDKEFDTIAVDEYGSEKGNTPYLRHEIEDAMDKFVELVSDK